MTHWACECSKGATRIPAQQLHLAQDLHIQQRTSAGVLYSNPVFMHSLAGMDPLYLQHSRTLCLTALNPWAFLPLP